MKHKKLKTKEILEISIFKQKYIYFFQISDFVWLQKN